MARFFPNEMPVIEVCLQSVRDLTVGKCLVTISVQLLDVWEERIAVGTIVMTQGGGTARHEAEFAGGGKLVLVQPRGDTADAPRSAAQP